MDFWQLNLSLSVCFINISYTVHENNPCTSAPPTNTMIVSSLTILKFLSPLWLFIYINLFCKLQWSFWTLLLHSEFNSSEVLTPRNNFVLNPAVGCMGKKTFKTKNGVVYTIKYIFNALQWSCFRNCSGLNKEWMERKALKSIKLLELVCQD